MPGKCLGPGPAAYNLPTTVGYTDADVRKTRKPQYSFGLRAGSKLGSLGPGPANYTLGCISRNGKCGIPAYSFGARLQPLRTLATPGPGAHDHERPYYKGNKPPAYRIGERCPMTDKNRNPGPNAYSIRDGFVKPGIPAFKMGMKCDMKDKFASPGPAAYTGGVGCIKARLPAYSFGLRTADLGKNRGPGPNHYGLQEYKPGDKSPQYSFGIKHFNYACG